MSNLDPKQEQVLNCESEKQLVSAGAGSGKTTVMIKKITQLLTSGQLKSNQIIVLTFTNLAAAEMKQKLLKSLSEELAQATDPIKITELSSTLSEIETSAIDTIDGFCSKILKKYFFKLNNTPDNEIASGLSLEYYIEKALDRAIISGMKTDRETVIELADCFEKNARSLVALKSALMSAFTYVMAQKDYDEFIEMSSKEYQTYGKCTSYLNSYLTEIISNKAMIISQNINELCEYKNFYNSAKAFCETLFRINPNNTLLDNINHLQYIPECGRNTIKEDDKSIYNIVKDAMDFVKKLKIEFTPIIKITPEFISQNDKHFATFIKLLKLFISEYQNIKTKYKVLDFTDLERKMITLLSFDDVKKEIHEQYKYIFVDEYQDINPMQDQIIKLLKSDNAKIFFVGDVKQSIYGFRQSTPELFLELYEKYLKEPTASTFDMNINFRTNPQILEFNNEIFNALMTKTKTDIDYKETAQFEPKRNDITTKNCAVEVAIFNKDKTDEDETETGIYSVKNHSYFDSTTNVEYECNFVLSKINSMVNEVFYDSSTKHERLLKYSDITILSRSINDEKTTSLIRILRESNIPINITNKISIKDSESVNLLFNLLKVIANSGDDVCYLTYITSNLIGITKDELLVISSNSDKNTLIEKLDFYRHNFKDEISDKIKYAFDLLSEICFNSSTKNNSELINMLLNEYHIKQYILATPNGMAELNSLNNFLSTISTKESRLPLEEFLTYLKSSFDNNTEYQQIDDANAVNIETIHASKGLEYPVVILFNASKEFMPNNDRDDLNFDTELGIGMQYFDLVNRTKMDSIPRLAIKTKNKIKCYKEELRLLYVATTRPQNRLIITGTLPFKSIVENKLSNNNYISLIYKVYQSQLSIENEVTELKNCTIYQFDNFDKKSFKGATPTTTDLKIVDEHIDYAYPYAYATTISLKNNVTAISKQENIDYNILPEKLHIKENLNANIESSAEIGTKYHFVLSQINFKGEYKPTKIDNIHEELIKLAYDKISPLTKGAINIKHESKFMMYIPYNKIYLDSDITDKVLVQGVVDLMIEFENKIILVDYKYSKLNIESLKQKYDTQLRLYQLAIESAYNKPVTQKSIYKITTGEIL